MKIEKNNRGFAVINFRDHYRNPCSLQKSSAAAVDCVWLGIDDPKPEVMAIHAAKVGVKTSETTGWVPYPLPPEVNVWTRMHLTREQVKELLPHLTHFVETGELDDSAPPKWEWACADCGKEQGPNNTCKCGSPRVVLISVLVDLIGHDWRESFKEAE